MTDSWFVTGALGCIGAWTVKLLAERGARVTTFDLVDDHRRIRDVLDEDHLAGVRFVQGDLTDRAAVLRALEESGARHVVHLAGLQVPFCKADPPSGALVNVVGTVNVFEAVRELHLPRVVYASSAAVYGPSRTGHAPTEAEPCEPLTHYGVFKRANEGNASVYYLDDGISSVGLRPLTVYGVGRDQGLTSGPTTAMKAAVLGRPFQIGFEGATDFLYVRDCAATFIASAERAPEGAYVFNLHGDSVDLGHIVELIDADLPADARGKISWGGPHLPIPSALEGSAIHDVVPGIPATSLEEGVRETMALFGALHEAGRLDARDLDR